MNRTVALGILALCLAIATAGCTSLLGGSDDTGSNTTVTTTASDGLTVSFRSISQDYLEDEDIRLQMDIENTGQAEATDISVGLSGTGLIGGNDLVQEPVSRLRAVDTGSGEAGGSTTAVWAAPNGLDLGDGESQPVTVTGTVSYTYATDIRTSFNVVPRSEFDGESGPVTVDTTAAPVHASIDLRTPRPIYSDRSRNTLAVPVTVQNVGDGEVSDLTFDMSLPNVGGRVSLTDCGGTEPDSFPISVDLFADGTRELICTVNLTALTDTIRFENTVPVEIRLDYTYTEEDQTSFTIQGLPGDQTGE